MDSRVSRRLILSHAREEAYVPYTRPILAKLGYQILTESEWDALPEVFADRRPDLRIVDERRLDELSDEEDEGIPSIVLTGRHGVSGVDSRLMGAVRRPAGLHEHYRLIQLSLEDVPRSTPRVPTYLPARCRNEDREWRGAVLSLSENGCLLRSPEPMYLGSEVDIIFELPRNGIVETRAETAYQLVPDLGLVFAATPAAQRHAIASFVEQTLADV